MDVFEVRGRLDVIAEELASEEEEEEATDEDVFEQGSSDVSTHTQQMKVSTDSLTPDRASAVCDAALCFQEQLNKRRSKLSQKIVEMENFASNLEEIFITVEVWTPASSPLGMSFS